MEIKIIFPIYNIKQYTKNAPKISVSAKSTAIPTISIWIASGFNTDANIRDVIGIQIGNFLRLFDINNLQVCKKFGYLQDRY